MVELGKKLRDRKSGEPRRSEAEIREQLEQELHNLLRQRPVDDWMNPLLGLAGERTRDTRESGLIPD